MPELNPASGLCCLGDFHASCSRTKHLPQIVCLIVGVGVIRPENIDHFKGLCEFFDADWDQYVEAYGWCWGGDPPAAVLLPDNVVPMYGKPRLLKLPALRVVRVRSICG